MDTYAYTDTAYEQINPNGGEKRGRNNSNLLFYIFLTFSLATFIFVGYIGVDHYFERKQLDDQIEKLERQLEKLKLEIPSGAYAARAREDELAISTKINEMVAREKMCDRTSATLNQIGSIASGKPEDDILKIWNKSPKPFLHLTSSKPGTKSDNENLDGMETVTGWEQTGGGECDSDPRKHDSDIVIPEGGNYTVYSQITFHCDSNKEAIPVIQRHLVQYIEVFAQMRDRPRPLMENAYQMCGPHDKGKTRISYQSGIYRFNKDDILRVIVKKGEHTLLHRPGEENENLNKASFGVYSL